MILYKFKEVPEDRENCPNRSFRWTFQSQLIPNKRGIFLGFYEQCKPNNRLYWVDGVRYYAISINRRFHLGSEHLYYDGPHCSFSIGFLHFVWAGYWCEKCAPDCYK